MCDKFIAEVADLLGKLRLEDDPTPAEQLLDTLKQAYWCCFEDSRLSTDEERESPERQERFFQAQRLFHEAGLEMIEQISSQMDHGRMEYENVSNPDQERDDADVVVEQVTEQINAAIAAEQEQKSEQPNERSTEEAQVPIPNQVEQSSAPTPADVPMFDPNLLKLNAAQEQSLLQPGL